eukprot:6919194-Karenia_brevis.AAC.1
MDLARNAVLLQARQRIEVEAHNQWRATEVSAPQGLVEPWQASLGNYMPDPDRPEYMRQIQLQRQSDLQ